jgi:hypothetical protein
VNPDDISRKLFDSLYTFTKMRASVNDRLFKVERDLNVVRKIFVRDNERQGKAKQQKLARYAAFFHKLCTFDSKELKKRLTIRSQKLKRRSPMPRPEDCSDRK